MELTKVDIGSYAPDFELPGVDGKVYHLGTLRQMHQVVAVVFMCNHCPYVQAYLDRLKAIQTDYADRGVTLMGINSNDDKRYPDDSFDKMKEMASAKGLNFPYLRDTTQDVAKAFGAERTPEVFAIDSQGIVQYNGRIDDNYSDADRVKSSDLRLALDRILAQGKLSADFEVVQAIGCTVKWRE